MFSNGNCLWNRFCVFFNSPADGTKSNVCVFYSSSSTYPVCVSVFRDGERELREVPQPSGRHHHAPWLGRVPWWAGHQEWVSARLQQDLSKPEELTVLIRHFCLSSALKMTLQESNPSTRSIRATSSCSTCPPCYLTPKRTNSRWVRVWTAVTGRTQVSIFTKTNFFFS